VCFSYVLFEWQKFLTKYFNIRLNYFQNVIINIEGNKSHDYNLFEGQMVLLISFEMGENTLWVSHFSPFFTQKNDV
jgi:hypothetical protein